MCEVEYLRLKIIFFFSRRDEAFFTFINWHVGKNDFVTFFGTKITYYRFVIIEWPYDYRWWIYFKIWNFAGFFKKRKIWISFFSIDSILKKKNHWRGMFNFWNVKKNVNRVICIYMACVKHNLQTANRK